VCYLTVLVQVEPSSFYNQHNNEAYWLVLVATLLLYLPNFTVLLWIAPSLKKLQQTDNMAISQREVLIQSTTFVAGACADLLVVIELLFYPQYIAYFFVTLASLTLNFISTAALCRTLHKVGMV
jgi:hypothetical protein